jgi:hypothetical protein
MALSCLELTATASAPLPQLLPNLHEGLDLARARKVVIDQAAVAVCLLVKIPNGWQTEMYEVVTDLPEVVLTQYLSFALVRTTSHAGSILHGSLLFAMQLSIGLLGREGE